MGLGVGVGVGVGVGLGLGVGVGVADAVGVGVRDVVGTTLGRAVTDPRGRGDRVATAVDGVVLVVAVTSGEALRLKEELGVGRSDDEAGALDGDAGVGGCCRASK